MNRRLLLVLLLLEDAHVRRAVGTELPNAASAIAGNVNANIIIIMMLQQTPLHLRSAAIGGRSAGAFVLGGNKRFEGNDDEERPLLPSGGS